MFTSPDYAYDIFDLLLRLVLAVIAGGSVGWDREKRHKAAGLRTHILVSLGAAMFVLIPLQLDLNSLGDSVSRTVQGIAAGVGFLGAGEILHTQRHGSEEQRAKGLTSAAAIWVTAALGAVAGCGLWKLTIAGIIFTLITLAGLKKVEQWSFRRRYDDPEN
ncbi:MgtC/SapB family protein [Myxacorys almedinensis]|uniref:MgtC/SapB family protein n=1 Tax=Myxacorys almedinensis A TaxID=2690445 RepID=A0A8J7Z5C6_9CYAN|nr:MgtC/SapB family protein [Myxacorys almedinensis]NDJ15795.1 MgtC/SapB family protein [Myxacorys almedinensis A]